MEQCFAPGTKKTGQLVLLSQVRSIGFLESLFTIPETVLLRLMYSQHIPKELLSFNLLLGHSEMGASIVQSAPDTF
jgi:hypothetical protein